MRRLIFAEIIICFLEGTQGRNKCLKYGKMRYVEVINDDEMVTIEVAHKQLHYTAITPRLK
jgi:hypothetical protein